VQPRLGYARAIGASNRLRFASIIASLTLRNHGWPAATPGSHVDASVRDGGVPIEAVAKHAGPRLRCRARTQKLLLNRSSSQSLNGG
jgi:hypothetical protein